MTASLFNYIVRNNKKNPNKIAYMYDDEEITYGQLLSNIIIISKNLKRFKLKREDKIGIISHNSILFPQIFFVASYLNLSVAPINPQLSKADIINQLNNLNVKIIFSWKELFNSLDFKKLIIKKKNCIDLSSKSKFFYNFDNLLKKNDSKFKASVKKERNSIYLFGLTSGSTSNPKITMWSEDIKISRSKHAKKIYNLDEKDKIIIATPLYHSISFRLLILPIVLNSSCIILKKFTPKIWLESIYKNKITFSIMVSSQIDMIANKLNYKKNKKLRSLKNLVSCCSPLSIKTKNRLIKNLESSINIYDTYGASEVGTITNINLRKEIKKIKSNGKVVPDYKVSVYKNNKYTNNKNIDGEICCKTANVFVGYKKSRRKIFFDKKKFFHTGDLGYFDNDGYLHVTGREKDMIIKGGINIFPTDIEKVLNNYPYIEENAVVGINDKQFGEIVCAFIVLKKFKLNPRKMFYYCIKNLADYQIPTRFYAVKNLPRGSLGKISKYLIKKNIVKYATKKNIIFDSNTSSQ